MNTAQSALLIASAVYSVAFAAFHVCFRILFHWRDDLARFTPTNRSVMQILNLCLTFVFLLFAYLLIAHRTEMISTPLGRTLLAGISFFWFLRMIEQILFFGSKRPIGAAGNLRIPNGSYCPPLRAGHSDA